MRRAMLMLFGVTFGKAPDAEKRRAASGVARAAGRYMQALFVLVPPRTKGRGAMAACLGLWWRVSPGRLRPVGMSTT